MIDKIFDLVWNQFINQSFKYIIFYKKIQYFVCFYKKIQNTLSN